MAYIKEDEISILYPDASEERLSSICVAISKMIDDYCNTCFEVAQHTEKLDSEQEVKPTKRPINMVLDLSDDGTSLDEDIDFFVYPRFIFLEYPSGKRKGIEITYTYGYDEVPELVHRVSIELAKYYSELGDSDILFKKQSSDDYSYERFELSEVKILSKLRVYVEEKTDMELRNSLGPVFRVGKM